MIAGWLFLALAVAIPPADCGADPLIAAYARFEDVLMAEDEAAELAFADCLVEAGLVHGAQHHYVRLILDLPPDSEVRRSAIARVMALIDATGEAAGVRRWMLAVRPDDAPGGPERSAHYFVLGLNAVEQGRQLVGALWLEEVAPDSQWAPRAALVRAIALEQGGQEPLALRAYDAVPRDSPWWAEAQARRVRLLVEAGRPDEALSALSDLIQADAKLALAHGVRARILLEAGRRDEAREPIRALLRLEAAGAHAPDAHLLAARDAAERCKDRGVRRHLALHRERWGPVAMLIDAAANAGKGDGARIGEMFGGDDPVDWGLPEGTVAVLLDDPEWEELERQLERLDRERAALHALEDRAFEGLVAPHLDRVIAGEREMLREAMGAKMAARVRLVAQELAAFEQEAATISTRSPCRSK